MLRLMHKSILGTWGGVNAKTHVRDHLGTWGVNAKTHVRDHLGTWG